MKLNFINLIVIITVLVITGIVRMPYEQRLAEELLEKKLIPERLNLESRLALKQKGFTAGFGSFRPTIAAFLSLAASNDHSDQDWVGLEQKYEDILLLDSHNPHYWEMASWHLISNAASDSLNKDGLPYLTRFRLYHDYIDKGEAIIERGMEVNPNDWRIHILSPNHYSSRFRRPNYIKAAKEFDRVSRMDGISDVRRLLMQRFGLYSLNKVPDLHQEAYELALKLFEDTQDNHLPSLLTTVWVGQNNPLNIVRKKYTVEEIFGNKREAYRVLKIQWNFKNSMEEKYGIESALRKLEEELKIPHNKRIFPHVPLFLQGRVSLQL